MVEQDKQSSFRETILREAPESSKPFEAKTLVGTQYWPFKEVAQEEESKGKIVFEAHSTPNKELNPHFVRVSYEEPYGLKVKRSLVFVQPQSEYLLQDAEVRFKLGDIEVAYSMDLSEPFVVDDLLRNANNYKASILVTKGADPNIPPLAWVEYNPTAKISIYARFPYAEFQQALNGDFEKRERTQSQSGSYRETYFQWEHLVGAKVGVNRYDDLNYPNSPRYYREVTRINNSQPVQLKETPYRVKITRFQARTYPGIGRLRFSRMNTETGESWMFSVPDWVVNDKYIYEIQQTLLRDFFWQYPVVFCVKNRGEERKWFSTFSQTDQPLRRLKRSLAPDSKKNIS